MYKAEVVIKHIQDIFHENGDYLYFQTTGNTAPKYINSLWNLFLLIKHDLDIVCLH